MLGLLLIVIVTLFRSGKTNFSESRAPAAYGSINRRRMTFRDYTLRSTLMFMVLPTSLFIVTLLSWITLSQTDFVPLV